MFREMLGIKANYVFMTHVYVSFGFFFLKVR